MAIRCSICKRFIGKVTYSINVMTEEISDVKGICSLCGEVEAEYDCYEDLVGYGDIRWCSCGDEILIEGDKCEVCNFMKKEKESEKTQ